MMWFMLFETCERCSWDSTELRQRRAITSQVVSDMMVVDYHPSSPFNSFGSHGDMRMVQLAMVDLGEIVLASRWSCVLLET